LRAYQYYDKLGRGRAVSFLNEGSTYVTSDTQLRLDGKERIGFSNPYRTTSLTATINPDDYWTTRAYELSGDE